MQSLSTRVSFFWFGLCLCGCLASCSGGNRDYRQGPDPADPSVFYDEPFIMVSGYKTYNGAAYDKSKLCLDKNVSLSFPILLPRSSTTAIPTNWFFTWRKALRTVRTIVSPNGPSLTPAEVWVALSSLTKDACSSGRLASMAIWKAEHT